MKELLEKAKGLELKVRKLVELNKELLEERNGYEEKLKQLREKVRELTEANTELEKQLQLQDITTTIKSNKGSKETQQRIDNLVREIDKCMALLKK